MAIKAVACNGWTSKEFWIKIYISSSRKRLDALKNNSIWRKRLFSLYCLGKNMHCTRAQRSQTTTISCHTTQYDHCKDISHLLVINSAYNNSLISILGHYLFHIRNYAMGKPALRVTDSKYRESLDRFEKSKTLKICLKNAFREFSSKILFRFSENLTSSRNSQKTKIRMGYWPSVRSKWLDIGQVLFLRVYGPRRSRGP